MIASEDEIRIVNNPPGNFQIRGIKFEEPLRAIQSDPTLSMIDFGKITINTFIEQYTRDVHLKDVGGQPFTCRYSETIAFIDCRTFDQTENIFQSHQAIYRRSEFSKDTSWEGMVEAIRHHMLKNRNVVQNSD